MKFRLKIKEKVMDDNQLEPFKRQYAPQVTFGFYQFIGIWFSLKLWENDSITLIASDASQYQSTEDFALTVINRYKEQINKKPKPNIYYKSVS